MTDEPVDIRELPPDQLAILHGIDRSEHIDTLFTSNRGELEPRAVDHDVPGWSQEGSGPHSVGSLIDDLMPILERGGVLLGAFVDGRVAGVAVVEERFEAGMAWLVFLHVSRPYRRTGIATALWDACASRARRAGAHSMYVSATPSGSAVGFYLARGCEVLAIPHPDLFAEEPEDVHLIAEL